VACGLLALSFGAVCLGQTSAGEAGQKPRVEVPPELRRILDALDAANKKVEGLTADVLYKREIPLLEDSQVSKGTLAFRKPDLLHLKLGKPRNEEIYSDGEHWWIVSHNDRQVELYETARSEQAAAEASFLTFGYGESSEKLLERYDIELIARRQEQPAGEEADATPLTCYRLQFVPRDEKAPARFAKIEVELADDLWLPRLIVLHESDGEIVHTFAFSNIELNPELKREEFAYEPPRGYTVLKP